MLITRAPGYQLRLAARRPGRGVLRDAGRARAGRSWPRVTPPRRRDAGRGARAVAGPGAGRRAAVRAGDGRGRAAGGVPAGALELRIEADLGCGAHAQLVPELRRLLSDQPLREGLWALLIRALDGAGRHAEALAAYGQAREVISEELGVDPGPELQRLYQAILTADRVARQPPAANGHRAGRRCFRRLVCRHARRRTRCPGRGTSGRGRSSAQARRRGTGGRDEAPRRPGAGSSLRRVPAQLPADVADFTGRAGAPGAAVRRWCREPGGSDNPAVAVAVVAGTPGLGKTALAIHAAHALRPDFPGRAALRQPARRERAARAAGRGAGQVPAGSRRGRSAGSGGRRGAGRHVPHPAGRAADADRAR